MKFGSLILALLGAASAFAATGSTNGSVTFYKDVLPVLQNHCQECHRPGEIGPMPLFTYDNVRPWAKAIKSAVATRKMPPWPADPHYGKFANDRHLSDADIHTLVSWADHGSPAGEEKDAPPPRKWVEGWGIGEPDLVFQLAKPYPVPESGTVEYTYMVIPTHFTKDTWVTKAEVRPTDRSVVHHVIAFLRPPGSKWLADAKPGEFYVPDKSQKGKVEGQPSELLVGYAPGLPPAILPDGTAKLVPAGTDIVLQLHYTPNGKPTLDQTKVGIVLAKAPPAEREMTLSAINSRFVIPPGDPNTEVTSDFTLHHDVRLIAVMPHMHLRGKDFKYTLAYPDGRKDEILQVPRFDFHWQLFYYLQDPLPLPAGTRIDCVAHFDNSANNPYNPDPTKEVRWGDQTWEEMMIGWFDVAFPRNVSPMALFTDKNKKAAASD
ncbi:MAG TPA: cytochrome c [Bryobacteraceae bacterium]|jgi:hypothetical protein|nr:cytochrome c [Bryobacteraceae bacterium]